MTLAFILEAGIITFVSHYTDVNEMQNNYFEKKTVP